MKKNVGILSVTIGAFCCYLGSFVYGISCLFKPDYSHSQALLIVLQSFGGMILAFLPLLLERFFHVTISVFIDLGIQIFGIFAIVIGEACRFYYRVEHWDDVLHFLSGMGVSFIAYCLIETLIEGDSLKHPVVLCVLGSALVSFSVGFLWEIYEYTADQAFGLNMQKVIPENELFNGGSIWDNLLGTDEEIAAFFRTPAGYTYALADTMEDLIDCFFGTLAFEFIAWPIRWRKPSAFKGMIFFSRKQNAENSQEAVSASHPS